MAENVCPVWMGYVLASPIRRLFHNPWKILEPYLESGMTAVDAGCAMGYFSLPMAELVGTSGRVVCVDMQKKMLEALEKRAAGAKLLNRIETRLCGAGSLGIDDLTGKVDFVLAFAMVHEVPDAGTLLGEFHLSLKPGRMSLVAEPANHVSSDDFDKTLSAAAKAGFSIEDRPKIRGVHSALLKK